MRTLGNILWHIPFLGFINAAITYLFGLLLTITVVAAPLGLGLMELGKFYLSPFGRAMVRDHDLDPGAEIGMWKAYSWLVMILWFPIGLFLAVCMIIQAVALCLSIVGIPLAIVVAKATGTVFNPVGKRCVSVDAAQELRRRAALRELDGLGAGAVQVEPSLDGRGREETLRITPDDRPTPSAATFPDKRLIAGAAIVVVLLAAMGLGINSWRNRTPAVSTAVPASSQVKPVQPLPAVAPVSQSGHADLLDTATLSLNGRRLPLAGLRAVDMPEATAAARQYLDQTGGVTCEEAPVGGWRCLSASKGLDIAEVFALSGFAKAAANATEAIRRAEGMARENRRGIWGTS